jgi:SAM-dependent methyltransferase
MSILSSASSGRPTQTFAAYEAIADSYDLLTGDYGHDLWLERLEALAFEHGLNGNRLLDLGCGTGKSFVPMLKRGYEVTACDFSPSMLAIADSKAPTAHLYEADLRDLPRFGAFDLVTALDDPLNYLLTERELASALGGIARNLAQNGLTIFDLNTIAQYRGQFARDATVERASSFIVWRGRPSNRDASEGEIVEATVEVFTAAEDNAWRRTSSVHRQRHWPHTTVKRISLAAGLELLAIRGQRAGAHIDRELDELVHIKAIYVARGRRGGNMTIGGL